MSKVCDITGKKTLFGNKVSHANNKSRRKFYPNLQKKKFYIQEKDCWIKLKLCTSVIRTINKHGISHILKKSNKSLLKKII